MSNLKKIAAIFLAPLAAIGMTFSLFTTSAIATGETQQGSSGNQQLAVQGTDIEIDVRPWCGWTALTAANSAISLEPAAGPGTVYDGEAIDLVATGQQFAIRVGPAGSAATDPETFIALDAENCSWFADSEKNGVAVSTTFAGVGDTPPHAFVGESDADGASTSDTSMNFEAGAGVGEAFVINNTAVSCVGFNFSGSPLTVTNDATATAGANVVTMGVETTTTNDFCSWTSSYAITIPAGLKPTYGDSTYTFTGPTVTNTMVYSRTP